MCFTVSIFASTHQIEVNFGAVFEDVSAYQPFFHVTGFVFPPLPIVTNAQPNVIVSARWGLIPSWVRSSEQANELRALTLNARSETMFQKPSFRQAAANGRALLPVNGFIEWQQQGKKKQPFFIHHPNGGVFSLGCLWSTWMEPQTGELLSSFSIVTTQANNLMSTIHNTKQRMPVFVPEHHREQWLHSEQQHDVMEMCQPSEYPWIATEISRDISNVKVNTSQKELLPLGK
jgi:putative SOS response-associated peptidase YedK